MAMMTFAIGVTGLNFLFLSVLFTIYIQNYRRLKAPINLGLVLFAGIFAIQKLVTLYLLLTMMEYDKVLGGPMFVIEVLESFAFASLLWISLR